MIGTAPLICALLAGAVSTGRAEPGSAGLCAVRVIASAALAATTPANSKAVAKDFLMSPSPFQGRFCRF
jgi:hypothetical protein